MTEVGTTLETTCRIEAPAALIFEIISNPSRHTDFDGSDMLRGAASDRPISGVGDTFTMRMHRLGRDYLMINYIVEFEPNRHISWEPAPGDLETAGEDPSRIGVPSGYRWGFRLAPDGDEATLVTEYFDCGSAENRWILEREGGAWINGSSPVLDSMVATLERLERICTE
jgi:hypothetical protein